MDPALVDRTVTHVVNLDDADLPTRTMTISGFEGSLEARILSTDLRGAATRLVRLQAGWGTRSLGAFSADVEIFVISGAVTVGIHRLQTCDYVAIPKGRLISRVRVVSEGLALLMTSAPVQYEIGATGTMARLQPGLTSRRDWEPLPDFPGRHIKHLGPGPTGDVWIGWIEDWQHSDSCWPSHPYAEECFVVAGNLTLQETPGGSPLLAGPGSYFFRPPDTPHSGPGSHCDGTALLFHRAFGTREVRWTPRPE